MTYNFDPELWYENELRLLDMRRASGELDERGYDEALAGLDERYDAMLRRLDGTYELPK